VRPGLLAIGVVVLVVSGCQSAPADAVRIDGRVSLGPVCPVEREDSPCPTPPGAFAGGEAVATNGSDEVRAPVGSDGTFRLDLPAGQWQVSATLGMSCTPVTVSASGDALIECDTGIR